MFVIFCLQTYNNIFVRKLQLFFKKVRKRGDILENWIEIAIGRMHTHKITQIKLAEHLGLTNDYISMIFRGVRNPKGAKETILAAIDEIIASKE